jgi:hypothetical protein
MQATVDRESATSTANRVLATATLQQKDLEATLSVDLTALRRVITSARRC